MRNVEKYKSIFEQHGNMMRAKELQAENILYRPLQRLIEEGYVEKVRYGYYQWIDHENFSEVITVSRLFPDAVLCMDTALRYYGYSDRTPASWHLAVSKDSGKSRFKIDYPFVKPYYVEPSILELGLTAGEIDGFSVRIYDKERVLCDCLRYRNKMDREIFNKAVQNYIADPGKNVARLLEYAQVLRVKKVAKDLIGVWL
jgi:predicted transcriptional regulator of viral defense system